ncbi:MAG: hypothetical protein Q4E65_04620 [Clostridia bacterium]|nr:hypothetical protein [Clostridia bacterium]
MKHSRKNLLDLFCMLLIMLCGYVLLHDLLGGTLMIHSDWDSYTLQALSWREGRMDLGQNYPWLELAVYNGKYYVSFPPVPSVFMLPLTLLFDYDTPNNFLMVLMAMATSAAAYFAMRKTGMRSASAAVTAFFYLWGSNMLWMSTSGGVWFQAQGYSLLFLTLALLCALYDRRVLAYACVALAVGCRPFSFFAFLPLLCFFCEKDASRGRTLPQSVKSQLAALILPALIGGAYMAYNYARFGNVLEFGHNYLPEFTNSEHGQFSAVYLWINLKKLFFLPVTLENGRLRFPYFDGFMFYVANPLFLLLFAMLVRQAFLKPTLPPLPENAKRPYVYTRAALLFSISAILVCLCLHKTLGGWQFGARYTVDMLPLALAYILSLGAWKPKRYEYVVMALGVMFNAYGVIAIDLFT